MPVPSLAELRLQIGRKGPPITQRELAENVQVDTDYISQLESGRRKPSVYLQARLATFWGLSREQVAASVRETLRRNLAGEPQK